MLGIASTGGTVASKALRDGAWEPEWRSVEAIGTSRVSACYVRWDNGDHVDIFVRGPGSSTKSMMSTALRGEGDPNWSTESGKFYDDWGTWSKGGNLGSEISIVCRKSDLAQDMVMYQAGTRSVAHMQWVNGIGLTGWKDLGGDFAGAPVLVALSSSPRVDFFGTGRDRRVYHFSWAQGANYSALESIGGDFESVPAVVVTSSSRLDLLAVGTDDKLKHRAYIGGRWANDWEDLGVFANSAPYATVLGSSTARVGIFVLGKDGDVLFGTWDITNDASWKTLSKFESIGGNMTTDVMEVQ